MHLIDTHTHIFSEEFNSDLEAVIRRAEEAGVEKLCLPNIDLASIGRLHRLADQYPRLCYPMMGLHPTSVNADFQEDLAVIKKELSKRRYIAIGEIGLDLYWDKTFIAEQTCAFEEQLRWSIEWDLPVAIHTRDAFPQVFESLHKIGVDKLRGVFHSFGGTREEMDEIVRCRNFKIGINGVITYKNAAFRDYLPLFPLERVLLETDAPYLSPVPYRGKRNEPAYLSLVVDKLAEVYELPPDRVARITSENALRLFQLN